MTKWKRVEIFLSTLYKASQARQNFEKISRPPRHGLECLGIDTLMYNGVHIAKGRKFKGGPQVLAFDWLHQYLEESDWWHPVSCLNIGRYY